MKELKKENEPLKSDLVEAGKSHKVEVELMARDINKAKDAATRAKDLLKSLELLADGYKREVDSNDGAIKVLEERAKKAEKDLEEKDELVVELSTREATAEEGAKQGALNLSSSADFITQMMRSIVQDLLAVVELEKLVGLELMKGECLEPPRFEASVAQRMERIIKAVNLVLDECIEADTC